MGQSLVKNYIHIVFSTKNRKPLISSTVEADLHSYLCGICKNLSCTPLKVGGYHDHVHILCRLSQKIALMDLMEELKKSSSKWIKTQGNEFSEFYWQRGYGAFSVNPLGLDILISYIENQHEHHKRKSYKDEYLDFLQEYQVEYDERYLWD